VEGDSENMRYADALGNAGSCVIPSGAPAQRSASDEGRNPCSLYREARDSSLRSE